MIIATIGKLVLAVAIGYYLYKKEIFTVEINQKLSYFILNITMPLLIITSMNDTDLGDRGTVMFYILVGMGFYLVFPFIGKLFNLVFRVKEDEKPTYEACCIFSNNTFMGYPVCASIYGASCIFYVSMFNLMFNLMYYTYGNVLFDGNREKGKTTIKDVAKSVVNPGLLSSLLAVCLFLLEIRLPSGLVQVCEFVGGITSPLSMVVIGSVISSYSVRKLLKSDWRLYALAALRLTVFPVVTYFIMTALGFTGAMLGVAVISLGMPVAAMVSMGCIKSGHNEELGAAGVVVTTILSLISTPILLFIFG